MSLNRLQIPNKSGIAEIPFVFPQKSLLDNQTPVFHFHDSGAEVLKVEFIFPAGIWHSSKKLQSTLTNDLITSGTSKWTQKQIAEKLDFYGSYVDHSQNWDDGFFTVYVLRKYAIEVLNMVSEVLNDCTFPEEEFEKTLKIKRQKFLINSEKVGSVSRRTFNGLLFDESFPYARVVEVEDYDQISREDIAGFYQSAYQNPTLMLAGHVDEALLSQVNEIFGHKTHLAKAEEVNHVSSEYRAQTKMVEKKGAVQSAIRIGRRLFNRTHEDFAEMQVLTTLLGGYFGSRLMSNLREDKGYTYGVGAGLNSMKNGGAFFISTEVGSEVTQAAKNEIFNELRALRENPITEFELGTVKNYMLGQILRSTDGVFNRIDRFKTLHAFDQSATHFQNMVSRIRDVQPLQLQSLANKWLREEDMSVVVVGAV